MKIYKLVEIKKISIWRAGLFSPNFGLQNKPIETQTRQFKNLTRISSYILHKAQKSKQR